MCRYPGDLQDRSQAVRGCKLYLQKGRNRTPGPQLHITTGMQTGKQPLRCVLGVIQGTQPVNRVW